jgi:integrase
MPRPARLLPPHVNRCLGRDGVWRYYHRYPGFPNVPLPAPTDSDFWSVYTIAEARLQGPRPVAGDGGQRRHPGSIDAIIARYLASTAFVSSRRKRGKARAERTKSKERYMLLRFADIPRTEGRRVGDGLLINLRREHVQAILDGATETPAIARDYLNSLTALCRWAETEGIIKEIPTAKVVAPPMQSEEHPQWTEAHIAAWKARHAVGTNARLALTLMIWTGQRLSDIARMGRQHLRTLEDGTRVIDLRQGKTGTKVPIPILADELRDAIDAVPAGQMTFLQTQYGAPFKRLGNQMTTWCREAGLPPRYGAHGLRYAFCCAMADARVDNRDIAAISGHLTESMVRKYTAGRDKEAGAMRAMTKLVEHRARAANGGTK